MKKSISKRTRIFWGIALPLVGIAAAFYIFNYGSPFFCPFKALTRLDCPGCGSGRAASALLHLDFAAAFGFNPLFVIALPFLIYAIIKYYLLLILGKDVLPLKIPTPVGIIIIVSIVTFSIVRNIV